MGTRFGLKLGKEVVSKHMAGQEPRYMGEDKEHLVLFTKDYLKTHSDVDDHLALTHRTWLGIIT